MYSTPQHIFELAFGLKFVCDSSQSARLLVWVFPNLIWTGSICNTARHIASLNKIPTVPCKFVPNGPVQGYEANQMESFLATMARVSVCLPAQNKRQPCNVFALSFPGFLDGEPFCYSANVTQRHSYCCCLTVVVRNRRERI